MMKELKWHVFFLESKSCQMFVSVRRMEFFCIIFLHQKWANVQCWLFVEIYVGHHYLINKSATWKWVSHFCQNWCSTRPTTQNMLHITRKQSACQQCAMCFGLDHEFSHGEEKCQFFALAGHPMDHIGC